MKQVKNMSIIERMASFITFPRQVFIIVYIKMNTGGRFLLSRDFIVHRPTSVHDIHRFLACSILSYIWRV